MTPEVGALVGPGCDTARIRRQDFQERMRALRLAGARKVAAGHTAIDEVLRVTPPPEGSWRRARRSALVRCPDAGGRLVVAAPAGGLGALELLLGLDLVDDSGGELL